MGDFESLRLDFGVEADARDGESAVDASERVFTLVSALLMEKVRETEAGVKDVTTEARKK